MNTDIMKSKIMFAWITADELNWLMILHQLEERAEEFEIESIGEGLDKLLENMNSEEIRKRDMALRGLHEDGLIRMDAEDIAGDLSCIEIEIKQRGRKVYDEAIRILEEREPELSEVQVKLQDMEKKENRKEKAIELIIDFAKSAATTVLQRIFFGN